MRVVSVSETSHSEVWRPVLGERAEISDRYNEMVVHLEERVPPRRRLQLVFRAYDEGAAFRYTIPEQEGLAAFSITRERSHFRFPEGTVGYAEYWMEGPYHRVPVEEIQPGCERPLTLEYASGIFACLAEAAVDDYSRMLLSPLSGRERTLVSDLSGTVRGEPPFSTPWRVLIVGDRPGDLLERNDIILNLNPPCAIEDTSWIRPAKIIRDMTLSTSGGKRCADFCAAHGLSDLHYDAGWYGHQYSNVTDATRVAPDPMRTGEFPDHDGLDLHEVIAYAAERGIGVWLYVNRRALERQMDELLPLYRCWGIKGIKPGFVRVGPQEWTRWLHDLVRKAAEHHLMVDVHDEYRPTGFSRTYPNLLTQEGVRGNEHMPTARHNVTLPFTRFPAGAADYTFCYYSDRVKTTHAHQLALPVVFYSPVQYLFWYDDPAAYQGEPEITFWEHVPAVWDETLVIQGAIGEYITVARRSGREWYVGSLTNEAARELAIPLSFLTEDARYVAHVYRDAPDGDQTRTHVAIDEREVGSDSVVQAKLASCGGHAMCLVPLAGGA
jgi:alpha-glucosidase